MFKLYGPKEHPHPVKGNSSWPKGKHCPTQMQTWVFKMKITSAFSGCTKV